MEIASEIYQTAQTEIFLDKEGILWLVMQPHADIGLNEVRACFAIYDKMGINENNKVLQIIDVRTDGTISREGRAYAASVGKKYFKASAVISQGFAIRLLVNFFSLLYKHEVPFKLFENFEDAKTWLYKYK